MKGNSGKISKIKTSILNKPFLFFFVFLFYIFVNTIVNKNYDTWKIFTTYNIYFVVPFFLFNYLIIPFLVATTINLSVGKFREAKGLKARGWLASLGTFGGILGGACPGCFVGLFPAFLGLFGLTATLGNLPLFGLEIQIVSAILLIIAINLLTRELVCKIE